MSDSLGDLPSIALTAITSPLRYGVYTKQFFVETPGELGFEEACNSMILVRVKDMPGFYMLNRALGDEL